MSRTAHIPPLSKGDKKAMSKAWLKDSSDSNNYEAGWKAARDYYIKHGTEIDIPIPQYKLEAFFDHHWSSGAPERMTDFGSAAKIGDTVEDLLEQTNKPTYIMITRS